MKTLMQLVIPAFFIFALASCGAAGKKEKEGTLAGQKNELATLKKQRDEINAKIKTLEEQISKTDTGAGRTRREKLVSISEIAAGDFSHFIELQGKVEAENTSYIAPRGVPGQVKALYIQKGDYVKKGQLVLQLDDAIIRKTIAAARQNTQTIDAQLKMARTMYERQKNLWDQNIGAEIQVIQAKTQVETLEAQIKSINENVKVAEEQLNTTKVYSDVSGYVDEVNVRVGEVFQGFSGFGPQIKVINTSDLKVTMTVPENHISRIGRGSKVNIYIPDLKKEVEGIISFTSMSIDPNQRGYIAEVKIPSDARLKPNQVAQVKVLDYSANGAITVPINIVQTDDKGKYVYVAVDEKGKMVARKRPVMIGEFYGDRIEVRNGLGGGDKIITEGYQELYDGQPVTTTIQ
jgi:membrane fusion protein, multidrug efflux system